MMKAAKSLSVFKAANKRMMMMMMPTAAAPYSSGTTEHHLRGKRSPNNFTVAPAAAKAAAKAAATTTTTTTPTTVGLGDPCLDLYFGVQPDTPKSQKYRLLKRLLPVAWSHNPLTTLKLICNLRDSSSDLGKWDSESFYRAAVWLHHNHPKTLASNAVSIAGEFTNSVGLVDDLAQILYRLTKSETWISESEDYRLLHDRVSDMFADYLRSNIQNKNKQEPLSHYDCFPPHIGSATDRATLLGESIAKKIFPRSSYPEYQGLEESLYLDTVRDRLRDEVLAPLNHFHVYGPSSPDVSPGVIKKDKYLEEVKATGVIEPGALLPYEILSWANDNDAGYTDVAQLQWEKMVEDVYLRHGKLRNCLVVCDAAASSPGTLHEHVSLSLAVLVSQLSGGPWKGKVINFSPNPELHNLPSDLDLVSKCAFLRRMDCGPSVDIPKVFDLVLQAAASAHLPPHQMINKVFLVSASRDFDDQASSPSCKWESDYEAILTKYKEKGYDRDAVPQIVFWKLNTYGALVVPRSRPGLATFAGFSDNLFKSFLDNDGQVGPRHVMDAAISEPEYQNLVVVD